MRGTESVDRCRMMISCGFYKEDPGDYIPWVVGEQ